MENLFALILGVVEGLTEFLPVSSTGHMILTAQILDIPRNDFWRNFLIIIQLGSILAVVFVFYERLKRNLNIWLKLMVGFFPTGVIGFFVADFLDTLFNAYIVVFMLIFGGVIFILIEYLHKNKAYKTTDIENVSFFQAFLIGVIQSLAMIPGTSRSGASIIGGLLLGLDRKSAAEFSFLLAVPTMFVATIYSIYKEPSILSSVSLTPLLIGFVAAFLVAILVIKFFLKFISKFDFVPFGVYRIVLGLLFFYLFASANINTSWDF